MELHRAYASGGSRSRQDLRLDLSQAALAPAGVAAVPPSRAGWRGIVIPARIYRL